MLLQIKQNGQNNLKLWQGNSFIILFAILSVLLLATCKPAEKKTEASNFSEPFEFELINRTEGTEEKVKLLIMTFQDPEINVVRFSEWYLLTSWRNLKILPADNAPYGLFAAVPSPNSKYMAVAIAAEGHPWIEIISLDSLFAKGTYAVIDMLNPYPGGIEPIEWKNNELLVWSDINLENKVDSSLLVFEDMLDSARTFSYSLEKKKFTLKK